jgi:hypothetical protein
MRKSRAIVTPGPKDITREGRSLAGSCRAFPVSETSAGPGCLMRMGPDSALSAEVHAFWEEFPLAVWTIRQGERFVAGPGPSDFVIPGGRVTVQVDRAGHVWIDSPNGLSVLGVGGSARLRLDTIALTVRALPDAGAAFASREPLRDFALALSAVAYLALAIVVSLQPGTLTPTPDFTSRVVLSPDLTFAQAGGPRRLAFELSPDWRSLAADRAEAQGSARFAILPEAPARARARDAVPLAGRRVAPARQDRRPGGTGARARLAEGPIGNPYAPPGVGAWAVADRPDARRLSVQREPPDTSYEWPAAWWFPQPVRASDFYYGDGDGNVPERVASRFGEKHAAGREWRDVFGNMFGPEPMDPQAAALGVRGPGPGGGGHGTGIGLGAAGSIGHGDGRDRDQGSGVADESAFARDVRLGSHEPRAPRLTTRIEPSVVTRVLAANQGRLGACRKPGGAADSFELSFTVTSEGRAAGIVADAEPLLEPESAACIARVVSELRFLPAGSDAVRVWRRLRLH